MKSLRVVEPRNVEVLWWEGGRKGRGTGLLEPLAL